MPPEHIAVEIGDERADVARGVGAPGVLVQLLTVFDVFFHAEREFEVRALR